MKKQRKINACVTAAILFALALSPTAAALSPGEPVEVGGQVVGITFPCAGVIVSEVTDIETDGGAVSPARDAGIRAGDCIVSLAGREIRTSEDFLLGVSELNGEPVTVEVLRGETRLAMFLKPVKGERGVWQVGLWLRDNVRGIGTVTFRDPETGVFGVLGHGVELTEEGGLMPVQEGTVTRAKVTGVVRGKRGEPGELCARETSDETAGELYCNTDAGIFGVSDGAFGEGATVTLAPADDIVPGEATILSTVDETGVRAFSARILRTETSPSDQRELSLQITDPELLSATGGIVQGMSGSPILQNGHLVGAVTHVLVSDPSKGYGITAENMIEAARTAVSPGA